MSMPGCTGRRVGTGTQVEGPFCLEVFRVSCIVFVVWTWKAFLLMWSLGVIYTWVEQSAPPLLGQKFMDMRRVQTNKRGDGSYSTNLMLSLAET
jgi:hypothetical protein